MQKTEEWVCVSIDLPMFDIFEKIMHVPKAPPEV